VLIIEDIPSQLHRFNQRLPPENLVIEIFDLEFKVARDDGTASIHKQIYTSLVSKKSQNRQVFCIFLRDEVELNGFYLEHHLF